MVERYFTEHPEQLQIVEEKNKWLPLHYAVWGQHGEHAVAMVAFLLKACPNGLSQLDKAGWLPLHHAADGQKGEHGAAVVTLLLNAYPEGARQKNQRRKVPADIAKDEAALPVSCIAMLRTASKGKLKFPVPIAPPPTAAAAQGEE